MGVEAFGPEATVEGFDERIVGGLARPDDARRRIRSGSDPADGRRRHHACFARGERRALLGPVGGMGLTGTILQATIRLRRVETGWIRQKSS